jgi:TatD DNase family protein
MTLCELSNKFFTTGGIHPCRAAEPDKSGDPEGYWKRVVEKVKLGVQKKKLILVGECGLDYDRLEWSTKEQQIRWF